MSYILDALRKADAQRSRGAVPDLSAQPLAAPGTEAPVARRNRLGLAAGLVGAAAAIALGAWWWLAPTSPGPAAPPPAAAERVDPAPTSVAPSPPLPQLLPPAPAAAPTAEVRLLPRPRPATTEAPAASAAVPSSGAAPSAVLPAKATVPAPSAVASAPPLRLPKLAELPPELRQQVPALTIGGAMHSENAANRMLIINGQLYREGDQPAPGVLLERIQLKSAVLSVRGTRFEIGY